MNPMIQTDLTDWAPTTYKAFYQLLQLQGPPGHGKWKWTQHRVHQHLRRKKMKTLIPREASLYGPEEVFATHLLNQILTQNWILVQA